MNSSPPEGVKSNAARSSVGNSVISPRSSERGGAHSIPAALPVCDIQKGMYKRIVLKLSGEALAGPKGFGLDTDKIAAITEELADVHALGVEIGVVVGGGNFFRGVAEQAREMDRVSADNMGMLSTVINAIALQDALERS